MKWTVISVLPWTKQFGYPCSSTNCFFIYNPQIICPLPTFHQKPLCYVWSSMNCSIINVPKWTAQLLTFLSEQLHCLLSSSMNRSVIYVPPWTFRYLHSTINHSIMFLLSMFLNEPLRYLHFTMYRNITYVKPRTSSWTVCAEQSIWAERSGAFKI